MLTGRKLFGTAALFTVTATVALACTARSDNADNTKSEDDERIESVRSAVGSPPGNNGTVKIVEHGFIDEIPDNDPHVGCIFDIEFRGFDRGTNLNATYTLYAQPPSGKDIQITSGSTFIGEDDALMGANDVDSVVTINLADFNLAGMVEHPQQGFHLKLEVHADGSKGNDTKYKVFWVTGCEGKTCPLSSP